MEQLVYVLSASGEPLMPTTRIAHAKRLLDKGKARKKSDVPFVIQLKYDTPDQTQPLYGGIDPGRTNIGLAAVKDNGQVVYRGHVETRNKEIPKLMAERRQHRMASRRGERLRRKRRAAKNHTLMTAGSIDRKLPGYEDGTVTVKDIINTEARFCNRTRPDGWLTPTARQLVETHISTVMKVQSILPVTDWTLEINRFAFMAMDNGGYYGVDFQSGRMKGYSSVEEYVHARQAGKCPICGNPIEHYHHLVPRHKGGSNLPENIVGLCKDCHEKVHTGKITLDSNGIKKKYGALSVLNQAIPYIYGELCQHFGQDHIYGTFGHETMKFRKNHGLEKDHDIDAVAIACAGEEINPLKDMLSCFELKQFRRHDRQMIRAQRERTYKLDGKVVCRNRNKRFEQKEDSLAEFRRKHPSDVSNLAVTKSTRYYNAPDRFMPGTVFEYQKERYVLTGQLNRGLYYRAYGAGKFNFPARKCRIICGNKGVVYT